MRMMLCKKNKKYNTTILPCFLLKYIYRIKENSNISDNNPLVTNDFTTYTNSEYALDSSLGVVLLVVQFAYISNFTFLSECQSGPNITMGSAGFGH